jgi:ankyrin repeat protein
MLAWESPADKDDDEMGDFFYSHYREFAATESSILLPKEKMTPLQWARKKGDQEIIDMLIKAGAKE